MKFRSLIAALAIASLVLAIPPAPADAARHFISTNSISWTETASTWQAVVTLPALTTSPVDTAVIVLNLTRKLCGYPGSNGAPTWRFIAGQTGIDTAKVEVWFSPKPISQVAFTATTNMFRSNAIGLGAWHYVAGVAKANDITLYPMPWMNIYLCPVTACSAGAQFTLILPKTFTATAAPIG